MAEDSGARVHEVWSAEPFELCAEEWGFRQRRMGWAVQVRGTQEEYGVRQAGLALILAASVAGVLGGEAVEKAPGNPAAQDAGAAGEWQKL